MKTKKKKHPVSRANFVMETDFSNLHYRSMGYDYADEDALEEYSDPDINPNAYHYGAGVTEKKSICRARALGMHTQVYGTSDWEYKDENPGKWNTDINVSISPDIAASYVGDYSFRMAPYNPFYSPFTKACEVLPMIDYPQEDLYCNFTRLYLDGIRRGGFSYANIVNGNSHYPDEMDDCDEIQEEEE